MAAPVLPELVALAWVQASPEKPEAATGLVVMDAGAAAPALAWAVATLEPPVLTGSR